MARALNANEFLSKKFETLPFTGQWKRCFGEPESNFSMLLYGRSGNGKTEVATMFAKYNTLFSHKVLYDSFEQGFSKSLQDAWRRQQMADVSDRMLVLHKESLDQLMIRLSKKKSPGTVFMDSLQYLKMSYDGWHLLRNEFPRKRFIIVSHAEGDEPKGSVAKAIEYDVDIKCLVKGFQLFPRSRFGGNEPWIFYEQGHLNWLKRQGKEPKKKGSIIVPESAQSLELNFDNQPAPQEEPAAQPVES